ncbi:UNVERIFIED_CONTAM: E3 ubiquitin-protein ligase APD1 [Sesamum latifolium]|uniref:E3 ubiquitin-protein ligase APD1 n=1 Tax=Sesamum latifolium TaxID=2727402 RepID=A0AAW2X8M5_9LAMI
MIKAKNEVHGQIRVSPNVDIHLIYEGDAWGSRTVDFPMDLVFYGAITVTFVMVVVLIVKLMWNCEGDDGEASTVTENSGLLSATSPKEEVFYSTYGTTEEDLESGKGSCCSSSDDLYDGRICVVCYDDERNCFFIPCGHYVTCYTCAQR